eukprot:CAMPEP_0194711904 /NCGR_PEP_ID=MMETSP0296-20130528/4153_1 /TAXON_ID=39354 /ORGANISM="Heterosigma akashiwo, Strain CCMP2393" /LENGTH=70 /DNA_ID=CAMNT_0039610145 /DNA_START=1 /DNA_END=214 /DNA_ORIENTATION=-
MMNLGDAGGDDWSLLPKASHLTQAANGGNTTNTANENSKQKRSARGNIDQVGVAKVQMTHRVSGQHSEMV